MRPISKRFTAADIVEMHYLAVNTYPLEPFRLKLCGKRLKGLCRSFHAQIDWRRNSDPPIPRITQHLIRH